MKVSVSTSTPIAHHFQADSALILFFRLYDCTVIVGQQENSGSVQLNGGLENRQDRPLPSSRDEKDWNAAGKNPSPFRSSITLGAVNAASAPQGQRDREQTQDILAELDEFVGESGDDLIEGTIASRQKRRSRRILEIQEEVIETRTLAQRSTLHRVPVDEAYLPQDVEMQSDSDEVSCETLPGQRVEDPTITIVHRQKRPASTILSGGRHNRRGSEFMDMDEWIEVEELLRDHAPDLTGPIPEAGNGQSVIQSSYRHALDQPQENAKRFETILRTMTTKLMQKRTTTRRILLDEDEEHDEPTVRRHARALDRPRSGRGDVRQLEWRPDSPESSGSRTSKGTSAAGKRSTSASEASRTMRMDTDLSSIIGEADSPKRSLRGSLSNSGIGRAVDRARLALTGMKRNHSTEPVIIEPDETPSRTSSDIIPSRPSPFIEELDFCKSHVDESTPATPRPLQSPRKRPSTKHTRHPPHTPRIRGDSHFHETRSVVHSVADQPVPKIEEVSGLWPPSHLVSNLHRYMKCTCECAGPGTVRMLKRRLSSFKRCLWGKQANLKRSNTQSLSSCVDMTAKFPEAPRNGQY